MQDLSIIYMHSERGSYDKERYLVRLSSANLIDFFLGFSKKLGCVTIVLPISKRNGDVTLPVSRNTSIFNISFPELCERKAKQVKSSIQFIKTLLGKEVLREIVSADYSVSVGLCFSGTLFGLVRAVIGGKKHSFVVRGNRLETVRRSSRGTISKRFSLGRTVIYERIMRYLLISGKAEVWLQGQERYESYRGKISRNANTRLFLLNAVLRDLPNNMELSDLEKKEDLIFVGRITVEKGVFDLIEALSILSAEDFNPTLMFIGEGPDKTKAMELAKQLLDSEQVKFMDYVSSPQQLTGLIKQAKLFVLPSYTEGLPRSMVESMYLGIPVLVTPVGGIKYVIRNGENGFFTTPGSPFELASKIKEILKLIDHDQADSIVVRARNEAMKYTFDKRAEYFLEQSINRPNS